MNDMDNEPFYMRFLRWEWEFTPIREWFVDTWTYTWETYGVFGAIAGVMIILTFLLVWRPTRGMTEAALQTIYRAVVIGGVLSLGSLIGRGMVHVGTLVVAFWRYMVRAVNSILGRENA